MTFDLPGGRRLVLAGGQLGGFWLAAGAAAVVLMVVLYREERKLVSRRAGLGLLALRMLAAVALVVSLFEPIAERTYRQTVRGRVLVAVDVSESMATADPDRSDAERARLVKVLGISPAEPLDAMTTMTRREVARRLIAGRNAPIARIAAAHRVEAFAFARDTAPASPMALADTLKRPSPPGDPSAQATDWQPALAEALKTTNDAAPVLGVVLVTDGRRNAPEDAGPTVDRLAARGVPVFAVLVGSTRAPRDAAVAAVKAPESVYKGDVASIEATLKLDGYAGREVAVTLDRPGASPMRQTVHAPVDGSRPTVTFRVPLEDVGAVPFHVAVAPLEGDVRPDNDRRAVSIQVLDDKAKVLLVDGEARWEFRYLRNALARDPRVAVEAVVFHQPMPTMTAEPTFTYGTELPPNTGASPGPDPLGSFDAVVIGDVDPADVTAETWARLDAYTAERGGTLIVVPGPRFWSTLAANESARKLLPVLDPRPVAVDSGAVDAAHPALPPGAPFAPTEAAAADAGAWPMLQLAAAPEESRRRWAALPRLPWMLAGKAKPGASALATAGDDPSAVVLAAQPYGLGKVLWIGTDGTWRWRHRVGDAYHHRFWGQVVRWAAAGKLAAGNAFVRFGPLKPRIGEGEPARLQARISEGVPGVGPALLIAARVFKSGVNPNPGEAVAVVALRPVPGQPRTFEAVAPALPLGSYTVRLDAPGLADALQLDPPPPIPRPEASLEVVPRDSSERVELAAARDPLDRLAAATGGKVVADFEANELPALLHSVEKETARTEETPLWDSPAAMLLFFAIVTVEWVARKRVGLP
jgi:hypothetical protein